MQLLPSDMLFKKINVLRTVKALTLSSLLVCMITEEPWYERTMGGHQTASPVYKF